MLVQVSVLMPMGPCPVAGMTYIAAAAAQNTSENADVRNWDKLSNKIVFQ